MSYIVRTRKGYYEERESYRDPITGKPRSRFLRYLGLSYFAPRSDDPEVRMAQMMATAERKGEEIDAMQREKYGETGAEKQEREDAEARFSQARFLEETTSPPVEEKGPADVAEPAEPTHASESEQSSPPSDELTSSGTSGSSPQGE